MKPMKPSRAALTKTVFAVPEARAADEFVRVMMLHGWYWDVARRDWVHRKPPTAQELNEAAERELTG